MLGEYKSQTLTFFFFLRKDHHSTFEEKRQFLSEKMILAQWQSLALTRPGVHRFPTFTSPWKSDKHVIQQRRM